MSLFIESRTKVAGVLIRNLQPCPADTAPIDQLLPCLDWLVQPTCRAKVMSRREARGKACRKASQQIQEICINASAPRAYLLVVLLVAFER